MNLKIQKLWPIFDEQIISKILTLFLKGKGVDGWASSPLSLWDTRHHLVVTRTRRRGDLGFFRSSWKSCTISKKWKREMLHRCWERLHHALITSSQLKLLMGFSLGNCCCCAWLRVLLGVVGKFWDYPDHCEDEKGGSGKRILRCDFGHVFGPILD